MEDFISEGVRVHVIGAEELSEEEQSELIAELGRKAPRSWRFREQGEWGQSDLQEALAEPEPADAATEPEDGDEAETAEFVVSRRNERVGSVPAAVLEEAAYRCPALARALGWDQDETAERRTRQNEEPRKDRRGAIG